MASVCLFAFDADVRDVCRAMVMSLLEDWRGDVECRSTGLLLFPLTTCRRPQVKSLEKDRQSEKRIHKNDFVDHIVQKYRTRFWEERNTR